MDNIPKDNRWHTDKYSGSLLKSSYVEWKYFNFTGKNFSGIFVYIITNSLRKKENINCKVLARIYKDNSVFGGVGKFSSQNIYYSEKNAQLKAGNNSIKPSDSDYEIKGELENIKWNLEYNSLSPQIKGFWDKKIDPLGFEKASWLVEIPKAEVKGEIEIKGKKYNINCWGYADSNWGSMIPLSTKFNWAQFNDEKISFVIGEFYNIKLAGIKLGKWSKAYLTTREKILHFDKDELKIKHTEWQKIPDSRSKFPSKAKIEAENKEYKIILEAKTEYLDLITYEMPFRFPIKPVVVEQVALFKGAIFKKEKSKETLWHKIESYGFKEYTFRGNAPQKINNKIIV